MKGKLDNFFQAGTVVIFGLSPNPQNLGRNILMNCKRWGYSGKIFGISPQAGESEGVKIYKALADLPEKPELAVIFTRAALVPDILLDCANHGISQVAVSSAGFEETGRPEGIELSRKVKAICKQKGIDMVGPNGIATANTQTGMGLAFVPLAKPPTGKIALLSQSGGVGTVTIAQMEIDAVPLGKFVSLGNKTVLDEVDFLDYLAQDPETEVICCFLEDLRRGREFLESAKRCRKPVIVFKAGVTPYGEAAASSHTAALKNDEEVMDCAFRQAGVIRAKSLAEMMTLAKAFSLPPMKGNRLLVLSPSGGLGVVMSDLAWKYGFELPPIPKELAEKYSERRRAGVIEFQNPLDFGDLYSAEMQKNFLRELLARDEFDAAVMAYIYRDPETLKFYMSLNQLQRDLVAEFIETVETIKKPVGLILAMPYRLRESAQACSQYPVFDNPETALACLAAMRDYYQRVKRK